MEYITKFGNIVFSDYETKVCVVIAVHDARGGGRDDNLNALPSVSAMSFIIDKCT